MNKFFFKFIGIKPDGKGFYKYNPLIWAIVILASIANGIGECIEYFINSKNEILSK
jgi:hypothetical protein